MPPPPPPPGMPMPPPQAPPPPQAAAPGPAWGAPQAAQPSWSTPQTQAADGTYNVGQAPAPMVSQAAPQAYSPSPSAMPVPQPKPSLPPSTVASLDALPKDAKKKAGIAAVWFMISGVIFFAISAFLYVDMVNAKNAHRAVDEIFKTVMELGGTLSGEHGIGLAKASYLSWELDPVSLRVMKNIKDLFDPNGILNPGKIFPR